MDNVNVIRTGFFAIDFSLPDTNGNIYQLKNHLSGKFAAIVFFSGGDNERIGSYMKDLNQGLPQTASGLAVDIVGICPMRPDDLKKLQEKLRLSFPLLSDYQMTVSTKYHVVDSYSARPTVHFCIFVIDDYSLIRFRTCEVSGLSKFVPEEFRNAISKLI
jgi:peroxiredoxin